MKQKRSPDAVSRHTVEDFVAEPTLMLNNDSGKPWMNPDNNMSWGKLAVYSFSLLSFYLFSPTPQMLEYWQSLTPSPLYFLLVTTFVSGFLGFWIPTFSYYVLYYLDLPSMERYKVDKSTPWRWQTKKILADFAHVFFGQIVYGLPTTYISYSFFPVMLDLRPETAPSWYMNIFWLYVGAFVFEFFFYWCHRLSHTLFNGWVYDNIHKLHHDLKPCYGIGSMYHHPLDSVITQWTPFFIAGSLLGLHISTHLSLSLTLSMIGVDEHSGYSFPFSPFRLFYGNADPDFHYYHHTHSGLGNYAAPLMDWAFGSDVDFRKHMQKKQVELSAEASALTAATLSSPTAGDTSLQTPSSSTPAPTSESRVLRSANKNSKRQD